VGVLPVKDDLPCAVLVYDRAGAVAETNHAAGELLGIDLAELVGSTAEDAGWLVVDSVDGPLSAHPAVVAIKSRQPVRGALVRARRGDGQDVWLQVEAVPQLSTDGEVDRVVATLSDVTHLIARSRASGRSAGDHIVDEVTSVLAQASFDPEAILSVVTRTLGRLRPAIWVAAMIGKDPEAMRIIATDEGDPATAAYIAAMLQSGAVSTTPIMTKVVESGEPLVIPDVSVDAFQSMLNDQVRQYMGLHPYAGNTTRIAVLVVPMRARGATIGTLGLFEPVSSNPLTEKDVVWMQAIADRTGLAVDNAQLYEDAVQRLNRLTALQEVSLAVSASPDLRLTLKVILDHVSAELKVDAADVLLLDEADNSLTLAASTGFRATSVPEYRLPADEGIPGKAIASRRIETVTALSAFSQFRRRSMFAREGFKSYGAVPLISRGRLLGALEVFHRSQLEPDQEWQAFLDSLGTVAAVAIDSATMQERLRHARGPVEVRRQPAPELSRIETEILRMAVEGMTNREIAAKVHLSQNTVKFHIRKILQKTGATNRTDLAGQAIKQGWL
jgi:PAS domain S-box-containing protein